MVSTALVWGQLAVSDGRCGVRKERAEGQEGDEGKGNTQDDAVM